MRKPYIFFPIGSAPEWTENNHGIGDTLRAHLYKDKGWLSLFNPYIRPYVDKVEGVVLWNPFGFARPNIGMRGDQYALAPAWLKRGFADFIYALQDADLHPIVYLGHPNDIYNRFEECLGDLVRLGCDLGFDSTSSNHPNDQPYQVDTPGYMAHGLFAYLEAVNIQSYVEVAHPTRPGIVHSNWLDGSLAQGFPIGKGSIVLEYGAKYPYDKQKEWLPERAAQLDALDLYATIQPYYPI